jgi:hypothetical protein
MNPPYKGGGNPLYLKIIEYCTKKSDTTIAICPTQWTSSGKYNKWYEYYRNNLKCSSFEKVKNLFEDVFVANDLGIYVFDQKGGLDLHELQWCKFIKPEMAKNIANKIKYYCENINNLSKMQCIDYNYDNYVTLPWIRGHYDDVKPCWDWPTLISEKAKTNFTKNPKKTIFFNFKTVEECENFVNYLDNDITMFSYYLVKINYHIELYNVPYFDNYENKWTNDRIKEKLSLTDEEVNYIKDEMKDFGWKTQSK